MLSTKLSRSQKSQLGKEPLFVPMSVGMELEETLIYLLSNYVTE